MRTERMPMVNIKNDLYQEAKNSEGTFFGDFYFDKIM